MIRISCHPRKSSINMVCAGCFSMYRVSALFLIFVCPFAFLLFAANYLKPLPATATEEEDLSYDNEQLPPQVASLLIVSEMDRISAPLSANAKGGGKDSGPNLRPSRAYFTSAGWDRRITADSSQDTRCRVTTDPFAAVAGDEIFEMKWLSPTRFHMMYQSRWYYSSGSSSDQPSDVSTARYEERKRENESEWERAFGFDVRPVPSSLIGSGSANGSTNKPGDVVIMIWDQYLQFRENRDRIALVQRPDHRCIININDASQSNQQMMFDRHKIMGFFGSSTPLEMSVPCQYELHDASFSALQHMITRSFDPSVALKLAAFAGAGGLSREQSLVLSVNTGLCAMRVLTRHLAPLARASPAVRDTIVSPNQLKELFIVLSQSIPHWFAGGATAPVSEDVKLQRTSKL